VLDKFLALASLYPVTQP